MNSIETAEQLISRLKLPEQDLAGLSFCGGNKAAKVKTWAESLPVTRVNHVSVLLYKAIPELTHLKTDPANRLQMLETIRPYVQQCILGLSKEFLNQPLILSKATLKTAVIAQALQKHMTVGYIVTVRQLCGKIKAATTHKQALALALHRAITGLGLLLMRSYQLYVPAPDRLWMETHTLYRLAESFGLHDLPILDPLLQHIKANSIKHTYLRVLLLACACPNQLRQQEVFAVYSALEDWTSLVSLNNTENQRRENLFMVNLCQDVAPMYKSRYRGSLKDDARELDTAKLLAALQKQKDLQESSRKILRISTEITPALLEHVTSAWGIMRQRSFERHPTNGVLEITVGLTNLHYHLSDGLAFEEFLTEHSYSTNANQLAIDSRTRFTSKPLSLEHDPWAEGIDASGHIAYPSEKENPVQSESRYPVHKVNMIDSSPSGYCLVWRDEIPAQVRAGELLGLREPGRRKWSVGVVRWLRKNCGATQLGVQLLASSSTPYAASMINKMGGNSEFMRVLMLPEVKASNQPATLLTTVVPFQEYSKVKLRQQGDESMVQLTRRVFTTGSISQFSFRALESAATQAPDEEIPESFASLWDSF